MRKLFENPTINSVELTTEDVIMASAILVNNNTGLGTVEDKTAPTTDMWKGVDEAWV